MTPGLSPGGAEVWLSTLVRKANRVTYAAVITADGAQSNVTHVNIGVPVIRADADGRPMLEKLWTVWRHGVDLVVYWGIWAELPDIQQFNVPFIHVSHASMLESPNATHKEFAGKIGMNNCHFMAAVSESSAALFHESKRQREPVTIIHSGVDLERTRPIIGRDKQRERWGVEKNAKLILYVGRFFDGKGVDVLLRALHQLPEEYHLVLNGWGPLESELKHSANSAFSSKNGYGRVIFPQPQLNTLGDVYAACDLLVLPSKSEALPLVMIEAWQAGLPVLCSNFNTISELERIYNDGKPLVYTIPCPPSASDVADGITKTFANPNKQILESSFKLSMTEMTASAMVGRWESYFYNCVRDWMKIGEEGYTEISRPLDVD